MRGQLAGVLEAAAGTAAVGTVAGAEAGTAAEAAAGIAAEAAAGIAVAGT